MNNNQSYFFKYFHLKIEIKIDITDTILLYFDKNSSLNSQNELKYLFKVAQLNKLKSS